MQRIRAAVVRVVDHRDSTTVLAGERALRFDGDSAMLVRAVLELHGRPITRDELFAALAERTGGEVPAAPVDELLALLERTGVIVAARAAVRPPMWPRRVVLAISGAVAAVDAPALVRGLQAQGCDVRIALTKTAQRFVAVAALDALTHHQVWRGLWQRDAATPVPHIALAEWAELVIVWPASATTIARMATGDCSDLVSAIATATRAPVVIAPSMNDAMLDAPAVQANLETLRAHGRWIVHPALGIEVAQRPDARTPMFGPAAPPAAMLELVRHLLATHVPRAKLPDGAAGWERLWASVPVDQLPWHADDVTPALAAKLDAHAGRGERLVDLGTGDGVVAIAAARRGLRVTACDVSPTALGKARDRAGALPILFVLDDVLASRLDGPFEVAVDVGLLHCLAREAWPAYARTIDRIVAPRGTLLVIAHAIAGELATTPVTADELRALLPGFAIASETPTTLSNADARLYELVRL
ncbi:MAG TPA: flavoprotein [Kofleriaceae bacterium]|nr:flavoprotein [Kofleriaceae bacterium]